jgi:chromosome partitioning protein
LREPDKLVLREMVSAVPMIDQFIANRSVYSRMGSGLLGPVRDNLQNKGVASHVQDALDEMTEALDALDAIIKEAK